MGSLKYTALLQSWDATGAKAGQKDIMSFQSYTGNYTCNKFSNNSCCFPMKVILKKQAVAQGLKGKINKCAQQCKRSIVDRNTASPSWDTLSDFDFSRYPPQIKANYVRKLERPPGIITVCVCVRKPVFSLKCLSPLTPQEWRAKLRFDLIWLR